MTEDDDSDVSDRSRVKRDQVALAYSTCHLLMSCVRLEDGRDGMVPLTVVATPTNGGMVYGVVV